MKLENTKSKRAAALLGGGAFSFIVLAQMLQATAGAVALLLALACVGALVYVLVASEATDAPAVTGDALTREQIEVNRILAICAVRRSLGLDASDPATWTVYQRQDYNRALAWHMLANAGRFGSVDLENARHTLNRRIFGKL